MRWIFLASHAEHLLEGLFFSGTGRLIIFSRFPNNEVTKLFHCRQAVPVRGWGVLGVVLSSGGKGHCGRRTIVLYAVTVVIRHVLKIDPCTTGNNVITAVLVVALCPLGGTASAVGCGE